jgi:hypothetical protein
VLLDETKQKNIAGMQPGQLVNCIPGVQAMSLKRNFLQTWQQVGVISTPAVSWLGAVQLHNLAAVEASCVLALPVHKMKCSCPVRPP